MHRPICASIDCTAISANLDRIIELAKGQQIMAVLKADAYGHGLIKVAKAANRADYLGVCSLGEAARLRAAGITKEIVLLEGCQTMEEWQSALSLRLQAVVHCESQIMQLWQLRQPTRPWLKIDTGMHRLGIEPAQVAKCHGLLAAHGQEPILMTHLANAGEPSDPQNHLQLQCFADSTNGLAGQRSIANSAALLCLPQSHSDIARPGVMLYGASPVAGETAIDCGLRPVMHLHTRLIATKYLAKGDKVGYGGSWECPEAMPIGIAAAGYGDGYPRHARSGTPIIVRDRMAALIAPPSMDMLAIDLRTCPDAKVGDQVLLWGHGLPVEQVASAASTIVHALLCGLQSRVQVSYKQ
ncbi:MAG: alanine racemase [Candidatus Porifericomitaceae bacterium WSBS_2022_MAG_OTU9]